MIKDLLQKNTSSNNKKNNNTINISENKNKTKIVKKRTFDNISKPNNYLYNINTIMNFYLNSTFLNHKNNNLNNNNSNNYSRSLSFKNKKIKRSKSNKNFNLNNNNKNIFAEKTKLKTNRSSKRLNTEKNIYKNNNIDYQNIKNKIDILIQKKLHLNNEINLLSKEKEKLINKINESIELNNKINNIESEIEKYKKLIKTSQKNYIDLSFEYNSLKNSIKNITYYLNKKII